MRRIWAPYGIQIDGLRGACRRARSGPSVLVRLRRMIKSWTSEEAPKNVLGSIRFVAGRPRPLIDLWPDEAVRTMGGTTVHVSQVGRTRGFA